jgi:pimeloyl-ACP methyl ester carboxylesterase
MGSARNGDVELVFDTLGTGPDVLLIGDVASTRALWDLVRPDLARSHRTIAFDNRDVGESSVAKHAYAFTDLAGDAAAVLDAAGSSNAHIVGHSLGGVIAQELALWAPERCASLSPISSWARNDPYARNCIELMRALAAAVSDDRTLLASLLWVGAGTTTLEEESLWRKTDDAMLLGPLPSREALVRQWDLALAVDTLDRVAQLRLPVHVVWGNEDRLLPAVLSQTLAAAIPNAIQTSIEGCGHVPMVDRPLTFVTALLRFLERVPA